MGSSGLEPPTSRLSGARSNQLSYEPFFGGDERVRTDGLLLARQALSQLSYTPTLPSQQRSLLAPFESALHPQNHIVLSLLRALNVTFLPLLFFTLERR